MAQLIFKDSGIMLHQGKTAAQYADTLETPDYDPAVHQIVDTGQIFNVNWVPDREVWFYFSGPDKFYQSTRRKHALLAAAEELIGPTRWEEIQDALEEQGPIMEYLASLDLATLKRKVLRAQSKGLITAGEVTLLQGLLP